MIICNGITVIWITITLSQYSYCRNTLFRLQIILKKIKKDKYQYLLDYVDTLEEDKSFVLYNSRQKQTRNLKSWLVLDVDDGNNIIQNWNGLFVLIS